MDARDESLRQIERIAASTVLRGSESLCKLLRYLARQALDNPGAPIREYQIATQVFGRPAEFDPRLDSTVRVQTGRLRAKLAEYDRSVGAGDAIVVEIPKGTYQLVFQVRQVAESAASDPASQPAADRPQTGSDRRRSVWIIAFAGMTTVALTLALFLAFHPAPGPVRLTASPGASLEQFWEGLLENPSHPLVVFHPGVSETLAIHELDGVFAALRRAVPVKPIGLLSQTDMESSDVIFVGPPPDNAGLRGFRFQIVPNGPREGEMAVVNQYPPPGEAAQWVPDGPPTTEDYAVISLEPGSTSGRWSLTLAGTTGIGTQAAVDFVCREDAMRSLLEKTGRARFEALLHTRVRDGAPADTQLVVVHSADR
ncbi:MAG: hypothetical protein ABSF98_05150 [Bryobacteraceae bacterium]